MSDRYQDGVVCNSNQFFTQGAACHRLPAPRSARYLLIWHQILTLLTQQVSNKDFLFQGSIFRSYLLFQGG